MSSMIERIEERLTALGLTERAASLEATGKPDTIRNIRRGKEPGADKVRALARVLLCPLEWLLEGGGGAPPAVSKLPAPGTEPAAHPIDLSALPSDLPVYLLRAVLRPSREEMEGYAMQEEPAEFCFRPPGLARMRNAYATYAPASALAKIDEGDVLLVAPDRPAQVGDTVLLTVRAAPGAAPVTYLGRLVGRDAEWVELGVDRPAPMRDKFAAATVVSLHKVLTTREIVGL